MILAFNHKNVVGKIQETNDRCSPIFFYMENKRVTVLDDLGRLSKKIYDFMTAFTCFTKQNDDFTVYKMHPLSLNVRTYTAHPFMTCCMYNNKKWSRA